MLEKLLKPYMDKGLCIKKSIWSYDNYYIVKQGTFCQEGSECVTISFIEKTEDFILVFGFQSRGSVYYIFVDDHNLTDEIENAIDNHDCDIETITNKLLEIIFTKEGIMQIKYSLK